MKRIILVLMMFIACCYGYAQGVDDLPLIKINVTNKMTVTPDYCTLIIFLKSEDSNTSVIELKEKKLLGVLKDLDINAEKYLRVNNQNSIFEKKKNIIIQKTYNLELRDLSKLSDVFSRCKEVQIADIDIVRFSHSNIDSLRNVNMEKTIALAREKAEYIAKCSGCEIGPVINILYNSRGDDRYEPIMYSAPARVGAVAKDSEILPDITVKDISLYCDLSVKYMIKFDVKQLLSGMTDIKITPKN